MRQVTRGAWMLDRPVFQDAPLFQLDPQEDWLYFAATNPDPRERQIYRIHLDGSGTGAPDFRSRLSTRSTFRRDGLRYLADHFSTR